MCAEKSVNLDEAGSLQRGQKKHEGCDEPLEGLDSLAQSTFQHRVGGLWQNLAPLL